MKRRNWLGIALALSLLVSLSACGGETANIGRKVGLDLPKAQSISHSDTHGGWLGDGLLIVELTFSPSDGEKVEEAIQSRGDLWNGGPFDDYLGGVLYGNGYGPAAKAGWPRSPEHCHWFFKDRHTQKDKALTERYSWNYTAALYDADNCTLYYLEFDT